MYVCQVHCELFNAILTYLKFVLCKYYDSYDNKDAEGKHTNCKESQDGMTSISKTLYLTIDVPPLCENKQRFWHIDCQ